MNDRKQYYQKKVQELQELISQIERNQGDRISGKLRISTTEGRTRYYQHFPKEDGKEKASRYLKAEDMDIARQLAQQEYEEQLLRDLFQNLHEARKLLVSPLVDDDETYVAKWLDRQYSPGTFAEDAPHLYTSSGVRVRSKSEIIIADTYSRLKIPSLYENPIKLRSDGRFITVRPDFTLLNVRTREQFLHEHFGMIDNPQYADQFIRKIELYEKNGIFPGKNLLVTWESSTHPLNSRQVELLAKEYLV
ncbi:MAG: hypothetical protein IKF39_07265 [Oscillospiraceae bacterium]|nr:hypothetical protein [Oscillospiraceae bacterium]